MIKAYLSYISNSSRNLSQNQFVKDFQNTCLSKKDSPRLKTILDYRKILAKDNTTVDFVDFGAGSRTNQGSVRSIKEIAKVSGTPIKYANLLCKLSDNYKANKVLELGTSLGIGTLSLNKVGNKITTIEGDKQVFSYTKQCLSETSINFVHALFDEFIVNDKEIYDIIFIDGNHSKEATLKYTKELQKNSHNETIFIFDDINWSKGMQEAWSEIIKLPEFSITIDLFKFGICFKRDLNKEHFILRY